MAESRIFAKLKGAKRVWALAAIHGEATRLRRLHERLEARFAAGDRLVYLGNYLGYGSEICETLDELLGFRRLLLSRPRMMSCDIAYLRGSQEEMWDKLLQLHLAVDPIEVLGWVLEHGVRATLEAYGGNAEIAFARARTGARELARWTNELRAAMQAKPGHLELLTSLRWAAFTDDGKLLFVHAGVDTSRPLSAQGDTLWWGSDSFATLSEPYAGYNRVVRGLDGKRQGFQITRFTATMDDGCGFGGPLKAACFDPEGRLVGQLEA